MPRVRVYDGDELLRDEDLAGPLADTIGEAGTLAWVDLVDPDQSQLAEVADALGLHPLAVEDVGDERQRTKLDRYGDTWFLALHAVGEPSDASTRRLDVRELGVFVAEGALVTVRTGSDADMDRVVERWDAHPELVGLGVAGLLWGLLDVVTDTHVQLAERLDERLGDVEEAVFGERPDTGRVQRDAYTLHRQLVGLRRVALPTRDVVAEVADELADREELHALRPYLRDVLDHASRAADWTESLRSVVATVIDTNLNAQSIRMNVIMKQVTSWAAIIAVPTLVTGLFGMNVTLPWGGTVTGFVVATGVALAASGVLYLQFKRRGWL